MFNENTIKSTRCNTVLVVDDDPEILEVIKDTILDNSIYARVIQCKDPIQAIELYHQNKGGITHVILDYIMPNDSGLELAKVLKDNNPSLKIALFSGQEISNKEQLDLTISKIIKKPDISQIIDFIL